MKLANDEKLKSVSIPAISSNIIIEILKFFKYINSISYLTKYIYEGGIFNFPK